jgi:5S rRNA maturation endonuclease (ribonuclease M5)
MTFEAFVEQFPVSKKTQRGCMVPCPSHDDSPRTPSLSVGQGSDGRILLKCFAGCKPEQIVSDLGLQMSDLYPDNPMAHIKLPKRVAKPADATPEEKPVIEKIYQYRDATGADVYQVVRLKPKSFRQRHRVDGQWVWNMEGVVRVLYRLPEILKATTVWFVEGEKDVDNLVALGFEATCNVGGAGKWLDAYTEALAGKDVIICGDNDEPGANHVGLVFESIAKVVKTVKIVKLPTTYKDASDFIASFKNPNDARDALADLAAAAHPHVRGVQLPIYTVGELESEYRRFVKSMDANAFPLSRWLPSLKKVRALVPGELVFLIGDTGIGKTSILQSIARAASPLPTLMFELELPKELMFERFVSMATKLPSYQVEENYRLTQNTDESLSDVLDAKLKNLFVCAESRLTVKKIEEYIVRSELKIGERPRVVLVDYIQLVEGAGPNRREKIADIAEGLKVMAKATRTIVIVSSQIARNKDEVEPSLHSAKESSSIEASCGLLLGAWREPDDPSILNIRILKSTKGGAGMKIVCNFDGARMCITERVPDVIPHTL